MDVVTIAVERDLDEIRQLDQLCFPPDDLNREAAAPGELEEGIYAGHIRVVRRNCRLLAV